MSASRRQGNGTAPEGNRQPGPPRRWTRLLQPARARRTAAYAADEAAWDKWRAEKALAEREAQRAADLVELQQQIREADLQQTEMHAAGTRDREWYVALNLARRALYSLAEDAGVHQFIARPAYRSGPMVSDLVPLSGADVSRQIELAARKHVRDYIRFAREAGYTWHEIGTAMRLVPDGDAQQTGDTVAEAAFTYAAGARVDRIAKNAECNKNLIYVYFQSKEALFATVLDRHMTDVFAGVPFTAQDLPAVARHAFDQARAHPGVFRLLAWATLEHSAAAMPPARKHKYDRTLALVREQQESGTIRNNAPPELILMSVLTLATAWSPDFPFGEAATPDTGLSPDAVRDWIADMVGRIAGQNLAVNAGSLWRVRAHLASMIDDNN